MGKIMKKNSGFSLVELMVSMAISSMVIGAIYGVYTIQNRSYTVQEQVSEMQQKGRAALDFMVRDIRMASYDTPDGSCSSGNVSIAKPEELKFESCDETGNKVTLRYGLYDAYESSGMNNGIKDDLFREKDNGTKQLIAEGVTALEFFYFLENPTDLPDTTIASADLEDIRSVQISMLIRATYPDVKYTDTILHTPASGISTWDIKGAGSNPPGDHFHRRLLITTIKLRNMGL